MIRIRQVRLIDDLGNQVGIVDTDEAKRLATEKGLDLVEVSPEARPPVCKIMDYGKFKYELKKKEHESRRRQHRIEIKEIRLRPKISAHDVEFKRRNAREFLERGDKVQLNMLFRGREMAHIEVGRKVLLEFAQLLEDVAKVERSAKLEGRRLTILLMPSKAPPAKPAPASERQKPEKVTASRNTASASSPPPGRAMEPAVDNLPATPAAPEP